MTGVNCPGRLIVIIRRRKKTAKRFIVLQFFRYSGDARFKVQGQSIR